ncbi:Transcriptional activator of acetoin dehydrogenase operon AcoR [Castellaniella defragrans 65Phen]|uniref:Transcriptional activator of acetoin dehydrogenase operon AcoR n=1 Tax=Castellaniella defragrans (strain DSM 12143 / CCUG 39792 / 65Phen) TaxID=1437824 RepID=W8X3N5_CASD6|nr:sigma-54-dependent Fis family transcriptional regulator [Castellaniella defragrans]CDM24292.1 Transcriptional activator of acetoin dehydrogenase operon AcoR [Castellaniella defragrans 65Phen]
MDLNQRCHIETVLGLTSGRKRAPAIHGTGCDSLIQDSWQRCVDVHGLDPTSPQPARILPGGELREHQERVEEFTRIARDGLIQLYHQIAGVGYVVLLTDAQGVTVDYIGDERSAAELRRTGLYLGADWAETHAGTCAVGTALATGQALTVHQTDHFDVTHIPLTCTAVPVFDSQGRMSAVLDASALTSPAPKSSQQFALQLVKIYAQRIENACFMRAHHHDWTLRLSASPAFVDVAPDILIALDAGGRVIGHNRYAQKLLERELGLPGAGTRHESRILGCAFDAIFDASFERLGDYLGSRRPEGRAITFTKTGHTLFLAAVPPVKRPQGMPGTLPSVADLPAPLAALTGGDAPLTRQLQRAARLVDSPINLLIHGETGSGKEYFAKALHAASARHRRPFVSVNCAAIPETLIESELFGHLPGSFSGAGPNGKRGLIQEADGGTLFLDEIGDMPYALQARLLRVLAEREVLAVGAVRPVPVDIHVISASHHDLERLVLDGRFREDLYYRLKGVVFTLPPVRERSDLDWLIGKLLGTGIRIEPAARARLGAYGWPGNLRELRNVLEYARAVCNHGIIRDADLPDDFAQCQRAAAPVPGDGGGPRLAGRPPGHPDGGPPPYDAAPLVRELCAAGWNVSAAARKLGISRMTLYRRMKRYGVRSPNQISAAGDTL